MRLLAIVLLILPTLAAAEPAPVFATVARVSEGSQARLRLNQDKCYAWGAATVTAVPAGVSVTQDVTPIPNCTATGTQAAEVVIGTFAVGTYRLTYVPTPVGFGPMPVSVLDFSVRPSGAQIDIEPLEPVALEPVEAHFTVDAGCEWVSGFRAIDGGFRIELSTDPDIDPFVCDGFTFDSITIGAFPPGTYKLELARPESQGGAVLRSTEFEVRPGLPAESAEKPPVLPDLSGFWSSPNEAPRTGITIIQSRIPENPGVTPATDAIAGIWYRYEDDGTPEWLWIDATTGNGGNSYSGTVTRYATTNIDAPDWQRSVAGTPIGTITINFNGLDRPARVTSTVEGETLVFSLQRFRWLRSAWPEVSEPGE